jgi:hypothetical protein
MLAIEAASVVDGDVIGNNLILTKHDGTQINAGNVRGPQGPQGPVGQDVPLLAAIPVLDVGVLNQIRAGRQLTAQDFTNMGLSAPIGLWNLSDLTDASGNGRNLVNKGAIPFDVGINGVAATAARITGSGAQALYIADTGAADPFRIRTGTIGCWFKSPRRGVQQSILSKLSGGAGQQCYMLYVNTSGLANAFYTADGTNGTQVIGSTDILDDRWHFLVGVYDGVTYKIYVDGVMEAVALGGPMFAGSGPLNIGSHGADASNNAVLPVVGRVDEAFVTGDILTDDQIRNLYCVRIPHGLSAAPNRVTLNVHRRRKGATLTSPDFITAPIRMYNFSAGSLGDSGTQNVALVNNGGAPTVAGADGTPNNAFIFNGTQFLNGTDAGLPGALTTRSYGCWFKMATIIGGSNQTLMAYGSYNTADTRLVVTNGGILQDINANDAIGDRFVADGAWHFVVVVEDNAAPDGVKRKLYLDGRMVAAATTVFAITLGGATMFRIAMNTGSSAPFSGIIDSAFVCDFAIPFETIAKLYAKGAQDLGASPKTVGDHVERMDATNILAVFDTLDSQHTVDLAVPA